MSSRIDADEIVVREYRPGDEEAILVGFNRVFAQIDPHFEPRTMDVWRWRYAQNPAGWRMSLAFHPEEGVIAQYAGMAIRMVQDGRDVTWNHIGDTFVDARFARALRNPGLFYRVARPFSDRYGGPAPAQDPVFYGLPTRRAHRIGQKQVAYGIVHDQNKLTGAPDRMRIEGGPGFSGVEVEEVDVFPEEVVEVFLRARAEHGAIAVHDAAYLNWRFVQHPEERYRRALVRGTAPGRPVRGLAVFKEGGFDGREDALVCDWLVPTEDGAARSALLAWLREVSVASGREHLSAMIPERAEASRVFQRAGLRVRPTRYYCVGRCYAGPYDLLWLHRNWYYNLGDFDLC